MNWGTVTLCNSSCSCRASSSSTGQSEHALGCRFETGTSWYSWRSWEWVVAFHKGGLDLWLMNFIATTRGKTQEGLCFLILDTVTRCIWESETHTRHHQAIAHHSQFLVIYGTRTAASQKESFHHSRAHCYRQASSLHVTRLYKEIVKRKCS